MHCYERGSQDAIMWNSKMPLKVACTCQQSDWLSTHDGLNIHIARSPESTVVARSRDCETIVRNLQIGQIGQLRIDDCKWTWRHVRSTSGGRFAPLKYSIQWRWRSFLYFARNYSLPYAQSTTLQRKKKNTRHVQCKKNGVDRWSASENEAFFWTRVDNGDERWVEQQSECSVGDDRIGWKWHSCRGIEHSFRKPYRSRAKMVAFVSGYQTT